MEPPSLSTRLEVLKLAMELLGDTADLTQVMSAARTMIAFVEGKADINPLAAISKLSMANP